jgi:Glycosyl hydrolase family 79 C-terminal beta domain
VWAPCAAARAPLARVEANPGERGPAVPRSFLGYSVEVQQLMNFIGPPGLPVNPLTLALTRQLAAPGGGAPLLRVGGGSTDLTYFQDGRTTAPRGMIHEITPLYLSDVARYLAASRSKLLFGINFGLNRPDMAAAMAGAVAEAVPRSALAAFEVGNEPDTYTKFELYRGHRIRPAGFGPADYVRQALAHDKAIERAVPGAPIAGPGMLGYVAWVKAFPRIVSAQRRYLKLVTIHQYPLKACAPHNRRRVVRPWELLSPAALEQRAGVIAGFVQLAARSHRRVRLSETNSIACGGSAGASDSFASALWGADWAFMVAALKGAGLNFHFASPAYAPFNVGYTKTGAGAVVHPLYYGMLLFAEATPHGARILPSSFLKLRRRKGANVHAWAAYDRVDRVVRVAVIDKDRRASGRVVVHVRRARGAGRLKRLLAPSVASTSGVTWGGQSYAQPTFDAQLLGPARVERVSRLRGSRFAFRVPAGSAALLTVPVR